ncbi:hypothetical protein ACE1CI_26220 [Aerosakkonemataceae cyanobacterium BLCC-F50]|uniref:Uncharacterized protein n=1 Tax=Floridaenema flaviceps BLCC-F50 TaxID=3153642 RepID=A0ABV4XXL1_9CYAN
MISPLIDLVQSAVSNKSFEYQENHTGVHGWLRNRTGNFFYIERGATGTASISILSGTEIQVSIPYSAYYERQIYWGLRNEYRTETHGPRGTYNCQVSLMPFINIQFLGISDFGPVNDPGHDSNVMTVRGLEKNIIPILHNSLKNHPGIENELFDLYKMLTTKFKELTNYDPSKKVEYVFHAKFVQIIESNNGNVIGQVKIEDFIMGDTYQGPKYDQSKANIAAVIDTAESGSNPTVTQHNYSVEQKQTLTEAAKEIQKLLKQLEANNPTATEGEKIAYVNDETSPGFKLRVVGALTAGGEAAIEEFLDNPYVNIGKAIVKGWIKPE